MVGRFFTPGTRVGTVTTTESELWRRIKLAAAGAFLGDILLLIVLLITGLVGWPAIPLLCAIVAYAGIRTVLWWFDSAATLPSALGIVAGLIAGLLWGKRLWTWLWFNGTLTWRLTNLMHQVILPTWVYALLCAVLAFAAFKRAFRLTVVALVLLHIAWAIVRVPDWSIVSLLWTRARYVSILFLLPPIPFASLAAYAFYREIVLPNLEITAAPLAFEEMRQLDALGRVRKPAAPQPVDMPETVLTFKALDANNRPVETETLCLPPIAMGEHVRRVWFYRVMSNIHTLARAHALELGFTREEWELTMTALVDQGFATKTGNSYRLTGKGKHRIAIALNAWHNDLPHPDKSTGKWDLTGPIPPIPSHPND